MPCLLLRCSTWATCKGWGTLTKFYTEVYDALWPICEDCLFLVEGSGQVRNRASTQLARRRNASAVLGPADNT